MDLSLILGLGNVSHLTFPLLGVGLGESDVAATSDVGTLLDGVLAQDLEVGLLLKLLAIAGDGLLLCDDSYHLASIKGLVCDLHLEG